MATRTRSRRALREQNDQAEAVEQETAETEETDEAGDDESGEETKTKKTRVKKAAVKKPKAAKAPKAPAKPRARKKAAKVPARMVARWAVCDGGFKRVAVFDYKHRADADAKLIQLREEKKGPFFLQMVKDPYDPPAVEAIPAV